MDIRYHSVGVPEDQLYHESNSTIRMLDLILPKPISDIFLSGEGLVSELIVGVSAHGLSSP